MPCLRQLRRSSLLGEGEISRQHYLNGSPLNLSGTRLLARRANLVRPVFTVVLQGPPAAL
jgi:hypothetical protein